MWQSVLQNECKDEDEKKSLVETDSLNMWWRQWAAFHFFHQCVHVYSLFQVLLYSPYLLSCLDFVKSFLSLYLWSWTNTWNDATEASHHDNVCVLVTTHTHHKKHKCPLMNYERLLRSSSDVIRIHFYLASSLCFKHSTCVCGYSFCILAYVNDSVLHFLWKINEIIH